MRHRVSIAASGLGGLAFALMLAADTFGDLPAGAVVVLIMFAVAVWLALIRWTYTDARRRLRNPRAVRAATALAVLPIVGPIIYMILRPPEFLEDAYEREISIASSEKLIEVLAELQQTQREIHASVKHLEQALHASRRRAAAQARAAQTPPAAERL